MKYAESINDAISLLEAMVHPVHNVLHARGVADLSLNIASYFEIDLELVEVSAWWHDTGRIEGLSDHELLSASLAFENLSLYGHSRQECKKVYDAIRFHRLPENPKTIEARILSDSDKLDILSVDRWKQAIDIRNRGLIPNLEEMRAGIKAIPKMRNKILCLEKSKQVFDHMITPFLEFLSSSTDPEIKIFFSELSHRAML